MTTERVRHDCFTIERLYGASPAQVFAAWAQAEAKRRWFLCTNDWEPPIHELDFRVGGRETNRTGPRGGPVHLYDARYQDIVPDRRIIIAYTMSVGETRISASLLTVELEADGQRTRLILTEQIALLDARHSAAEREEGTRELLERLAESVEHSPPA